MSDDKVTKLRDPLFVIGTALEIIKQRSSDKKIQPEIKRIEGALSRITDLLQ